MFVFLKIHTTVKKTKAGFHPTDKSVGFPARKLFCKDVTEYLRGEGIYAEITDIESLTKELDYLDIDYSLNQFKYVDVDELD